MNIYSTQLPKPLFYVQIMHEHTMSTIYQPRKHFSPLSMATLLSINTNPVLTEEGLKFLSKNYKSSKSHFIYLSPQTVNLILGMTKSEEA